MPFTFCHPAIILPLNKISQNKISLTGLIVGSLAPDFEYFIRMQMMRTHSHELSAIVWFNLPICFLLAFIYQGIVKKPMVNHMPHFLSSRLKTYHNINWFMWFKKYWYVFIYSALIGVFSHILWDSFTHIEGIFGNHLSFLSHEISIFGRSNYIFSWLQEISTIIGGGYIFYFIMKLPSNSVQSPPLINKLSFWTIAGIVAFIILLIKDIPDIPTFIATSIAAGLYGIIFSSLLSRYLPRLYSPEKITIQ